MSAYHNAIEAVRGARDARGDRIDQVGLQFRIARAKRLIQLFESGIQVNRTELKEARRVMRLVESYRQGVQ